MANNYYRQFKLEPFENKHNLFVIYKKLSYNNFQPLAYIKMFSSFDWDIDYIVSLSFDEKIFIEKYLERFFKDLSQMDIRHLFEGKDFVSLCIIKKHSNKRVSILASVTVLTKSSKLIIRNKRLSSPALKYFANLLKRYY